MCCVSVHSQLTIQTVSVHESLSEVCRQYDKKEEGGKN